MKEWRGVNHRTYITLIVALLVLVVALGLGGYAPWATLVLEMGASALILWCLVDILWGTRPDERAFHVEVLDLVFRDDVTPLDEVDEDVTDNSTVDLVVSVDPATGKRRRRKKSDRHALTVVLGDSSTSWASCWLISSTGVQGSRSSPTRLRWLRVWMEFP